ncbi:thiamine phosphate synthase [Veronia nyctiphanis]|uniref:Thiamine-phosphate synthase n=1 Tax=Veronia nyctiphanis TaxID=1278244 RepID=A0A4Q0Z032_9GAMM|nr:thiamine phosphate synthase [Veronia nyctiphanis]RXJ74779.1 thiamine phosphate synthase [Veronia nyctiphanis]
MNPYQLYLVTDENIDTDAITHIVATAIEGGVTMVQLREKKASTRQFLTKAQALKRVTADAGVPLIINDRVDIALAVDADGVHLGQSDMPVKKARELLGPEKLIGLSIESESQLADVSNEPLDYIGLSAIFATNTKTDTIKAWGLDGLKHAVAMSPVPVVAIGGINETNISDIYRTGAHGAALVSAICSAQDPAAASRTLKLKMPE